MKPADSVWPTYQRFLANYPALVPRLGFDPAALRTIAAVAGLITLYVAGTFAPIPMLRPQSADGAQTWWFLKLFDELFTGGAFGRGALLSLGLLAGLTLGGLSRPWLRRYAYHAVLTLLVMAALVKRSAVPPRLLPMLGAFALLYLGGVVVVFLNRRLLRNNGPQVLHLNVFMLIFRYYRTLVGELLQRHAAVDLYLAAGGLVFLCASAAYVSRTKLFLEVENIKSAADQRRVTLEVRGIDENALELLGITNVVMFLSLSGVVSLLAGWRTMTAHVYGFAVISGAVFLLVAALLGLARRLLTSRGSIMRYARDLLASDELSKLYDPFRYAMQMLNHYWVIPRVAAGLDTERFIEDKLRTLIRRSFWIFTLWFVVISAVQLYAVRYGAGLMLFPYGPLVFISLFLICVSWASAIAQSLAAELSHWRQTARGKSRLVAQTFPLRSKPMRHLELAGPARRSEGDEKLGDDLRDILQWLRFLHQAGVQPRQMASLPHKARLFARFSQLVVGLISGALFAFIGGLIYVVALPGSSPRDIVNVVVPLFVAGAFSPNVFWNWLQRKRTTA
jgi:hypothetical protein